MNALTCLLALVFADLTLPPAVSGSPGQFIEVPATTSFEALDWHAVDRGLIVFPANRLRDSKSAVVIALTPGKYRLVACTPLSSPTPLSAITIVTVGEPAPPPPPVDPVDPVDPPPPPANLFLTALQTAYTADADPEKATHKKALANLYAQAATDTFLAKQTNWNAMLASMATQAPKFLPTGKLLGVRMAIQEEMKRSFPAKVGPMDDAARALAKNTFLRIGGALEKVQ